MRCLITGGAGFIGGHLYSKLTQMGHEVTGIDNFFHPSKNPINQEIRKVDIRSFSEISDYIYWSDIVIHLAAQIHVDYSNQFPVETFDINVNGFLNVLETCRKHHKKLIFASSSEIYGSSQTDFMDETHPLNPQSPYAVTKLAADKLCAVYRDTYGMQINVVRNFNTFGEWQNDTSYGGVIAKFTKAALTGAPLTIYGDGTQQRDYMYIDDAMQGYLMALSEIWTIPLNFGTGQTVTINDLAQLIIKITNSSSKIINGPSRVGEVQRLCAGIARAKQVGFVSNTNLERDLTKYINWYKQQL